MPDEPTAAARPFVARGFDLQDWQRKAVEAWISGDAGGPFRGTLEIFTGGGKTLIALACAEAAQGVSHCALRRHEASARCHPSGRA